MNAADRTPASNAFSIVGDAEGKILRAKGLVELIFMAGNGLEQPMKDALATGADVIDEILNEALELLHEAKIVAKGGLS